ncbi:uncharacterized protein LOC113855628 [Abrus precatorius]|uniref:Uncharacterized protein LOC113855628 n=1 Tax=Abrus precatorius TaxID=3816 RepID=A0A8B8KH20_ABRPR|nr:uncharacterized protein LOC113855628 [Abrus precatorius]
MYQNLWKSFWWNEMKRDVAEYVARCLTCQKAKVEHQCPPRLLQPLEISEWKWDNISMDFVSRLLRTRNNHDAIWVIMDRLTKATHFLPINMKYKSERLVDFYHASIGMTPFEVLYGRRCRTPLCWYENGEATLCALDMIQKQNEQIKMIKVKIKVAQDRQKSYYNKRRKSLEFQVGDHVFFKVSPLIEVGRALKS